MYSPYSTSQCNIYCEEGRGQFHENPCNPDNRIELSQENSLPKWKTTAVPPETGRRKRYGHRESRGRNTKVFWVRICKRLRSPGVDSKESIQPTYVACGRLRQIGLSYRPTRFTNTGSVIYPVSQDGWFRNVVIVVFKVRTNDALLSRLATVSFSRLFSCDWNKGRIHSIDYRSVPLVSLCSTCQREKV